MDLDVKTIITEIRIYADENNHFTIPAEYRSDVIYGPNVKALSVTLYSEGVMSNDRIAAFLNAASEDELSLSAGSVYGFCKKFAAKSEMSIEHLEQELLNQDVVATDATTVTNNGEQNFIRNFSITETVLYRAMKCKTIEAMHKINFLENFTGIQKMAGGFRKDSGHEMYCSILTIIETLKRRKMAMIENIKKIFMGTPTIF